MVGGLSIDLMQNVLCDHVIKLWSYYLFHKGLFFY